MVEGADIAGHEIHLISTLSCVSFPAGQQIGDQSGLASKLIPLMPNRACCVIAYLCADLYVSNDRGYRHFSVVICIAEAPCQLCAAYPCCAGRG